MRSPLLAALVTLSLVGRAEAQGSTSPAPPAPSSEAWWAHVTALADDSMRGREAGTREHRRAADYVASAFAKAGLAPAGSEGFLQPVQFIRRRVVETRSSAALVRKGKVEALRLGTDATINLRNSRAGSVDAPVVFVGYGLRAPEIGIDDYARTDLRGKVALIMSGAPKGMDGPALAAARGAGSKALRESGAVAVVTVYSAHSDLPWERYAASRLHAQLRLADQDASHSGPSMIGVTVNPAAAERLFAGAPQPYAKLLVLADSGAPLPGFTLPVSLRATVAVEEAPAVSHNVVGMLRGSDSRLREEFLVLTAHLDHLGVSEPIDGDSIFNGAMDNASGIATLIETARLVAAGTPRPKRSVAFVAVTAEEHGLLGSEAFAAHPTIPGGTIVADLNTDMYLPINPLRKLLVNGLEESDLADDVRRAARRVNVEVITDPEPERNAFVRSDQFSFIRRGIPALSLKVGFALGTPEHERVLQWRRERYHGVEDEVTQPVDRQAAAEFNRLYAELVREVANRPTRPDWYPTSQFRPEAAGTN